MPQDKLPVPQFAAKIKAKYPQYKDIDDTVLVQKILAKYPEYNDQVDMTVVVKKKGGTDLSTVGVKATPSGGQVGSSKAPSSGLVPTGTETQADIDRQKKFAEMEGVEYDPNDPLKSYVRANENKFAKQRQKPVTESTSSKVVKLAESIQNKEAVKEKAQIESFRFNNVEEAKEFAYKRLDKSKLVPKSSEVDLTQAEGVENYTDESILNAAGDNITVNKAVSQYLRNKNVKENLQSSANFSEAAIKTALTKNDDRAAQISKLLASGREIPSTMRGDIVLEYLNDPDVLEEVSSNPELLSQYRKEIYDFPKSNPETAIKIMAQMVSKKREEKGYNNGLLNAPSKSTTDEIIDELVQEGQLSVQYKYLYERPGVGMAVNSSLKTPGFIEGTLQSTNEAVEGIGSTLKGLADMAIYNVGGNIAEETGLRNLYSTEEQQAKNDFYKSTEGLYNGLDREYSEVAFKPNGILHEFTTAGGLVTGQVLPMIAGGSVLKAANLVNTAEGSNMIMAGMQSFGRNKERAAVELPNASAEKQLAYATLNTGIEMALSNVFNDVEYARKLMKGVSPGVKSVITRFTNKEITESVAKQSINDIFLKVAEKGGQVAKGMVGVAEKEAREEYLTEILQIANNQVFGGQDVDAYDIAKKSFDVWRTTFLGSLPLGVGGGVIEVSKNPTMQKLVYEMATNPEKYAKIIQENSQLDEKYGADLDQKMSNLEYIAKVKQDLDAMEGMNQVDKEKFLITSLNQKIVADQAAQITEPTLRKEPEKAIEKLEAEKEQILSNPTPLTEEQKVIKKALDNGDLRDGYKAYAENALKDPKLAVSFLQEIAQQANNEVASLGEANTDTNAIDSFGIDLFDYSTKKYPKSNPQQEIVVEEEETPQPIELDPTLPEGYELPGQPKEEAGSVGVGGDIPQFAAKSEKHFEYVPIEEVDAYKEFDRETEKKFDKKELDDLTDDIRINGIKKPIQIKVDRNGNALIVEGNTRLAAAKRLGIKNIPVEIIEGEFGEINKSKAKSLPDIGRSELQRRQQTELGLKDINGAYSKGFTRVEQVMKEQSKSDVDAKKEAIETEKQQAITEATKPVVDLQLLGDETDEPKVSVYSERPGTELSFRGLQNVANEFGLDDIVERDRKSDIQLYTDAQNKIDGWVENGKYTQNIERLLSGVEKKEINLTDEQRVILQKHLANQVGKLRDIKDKNSKEWDDQFKVVKRLKEVGNIARSESGAALRIPIGMTSHPVADYGDAMVSMAEAAGVEELTDAQKKEVEKYVADYEKKLADSEQKVADIQAKFSELKAKKALGEVVAKTKKTNKDYASERKQIISDIQAKLKKSRNELSAAPIPYAKELFEIAPDVAKLVKSLVEQGISKLDDVVKEVYGIISPEINGIQEKDVVDLVAGLYDEKKDTRAELDKKLKSIANKKSAEALKIQAKIKAGDFQKQEKSESWVSDSELKAKYPQLYKDALDALYAKEQAKLDYDIALYKAQLAQRGKVRKGIDLVRAIIATTKAVKSGIDDSAIMMQNIVAMVAHPRSAIKALREHALDAVSEKRFRRYLTELHESPIWNLMEKSGLDITNPQSLKEQNKEEIFDNNLLNKDIVIRGKKYNIGKYATRPFERAFTSLGNAMRVNMFTKIANRMIDEGKTFETHPDEFKSLAKVLNTQTGRGKLHTQVERASQLVTSGIWSPRLMASRLNMLGLGDVMNFALGNKGYYANLTPEMRKMALVDMVKFIGTGVALMLFAGASGAGTDDDPYSPTFGTIRIGNRRYNAWGGFTPYVKTIFQSISGKRHINGEEQKVTRAKVIGSFFRSRLTPAAGVATNVLVGKDFSGKPITPEGELANLIMPMSVNAVANAAQKDGMVGVLLEGIPSFIGVGVSDERDFENTIKVVPKIYYKGVYVELPDNLKNSYQKLIDKNIKEYKETAKKDPNYSSLSDAQKDKLNKIAKSVGIDEAEKEMIKNNKDFFNSSYRQLRNEKKKLDAESKQLKQMLK